MSDALSRLKETELLILRRFDAICRANRIEYFMTGGTLLGAVRHKGFIPWDDDIDLLMFEEEYQKLKKWWIKNRPTGLFLQDPDTDSEWPFPYAKIRLKGTTFLEASYSKRPRHCEISIDIFVVYPCSITSASSSFWNRQRWLYCQMYESVTGCPSLREYASLAIRAKNPFPKLANKKLISCVKKHALLRQEAENALYLSVAALIFPCRSYDETVFLPFEDHAFPAPVGWNAVLENQYGNYMQLPPEEERVPHHTIVELDFGTY